jgi:hypothetical protein
MKIKTSAKGKKGTQPKTKACVSIEYYNEKSNHYKEAKYAISRQTLLEGKPSSKPMKPVTECSISESFIVDTVQFTPKKEILFEITYPDGISGAVCAYSEDLKQSTWSQKNVLLERDIKEWIAFLYRCYAGKKNAQLTEDAIELRNTLRRIVSVSKCH